MLLTIWFPGATTEQIIELLGGEEEQQIEFRYGDGLAWIGETAQGPAVHLSLLIRTEVAVALTRRRDREQRFSIGYCDAYPYTASGLMGLFLARLGLAARVPEKMRMEADFFCYPKRPYGPEIVNRLFGTYGFTVEIEHSRLHFAGDGRLGDLPALLLTLDRRTRLFLTTEELKEIGRFAEELLARHPAARAIESAISGRHTPLRALVPTAELARSNHHGDDAEGIEIASSSELLARMRVSESQRDFAVQAFSKINIDKRWLIFLPWAIASLQTPESGADFERPEDAISYYRDELIEKVVVQEKHMGSRGIVVLCSTHEAARERFGIDSESAGCAYTRNGRRFFNDDDTEAVFLERLRGVLSRSRFWQRFSTNWVLLDGEIMPWSFKASDSSEESDLAEAGFLALKATVDALGPAQRSAVRRHWLERLEQRISGLNSYNAMFKKYRNESHDLRALRFAPFHLLATEGRTFFDCPHPFHIEVLSRIAKSGAGFVIPTRHQTVSTSDRGTWEQTIRWWEEIANDFSEGFVVKPFPFVPRGRRGSAQPALKCRSAEHLRLVYGPDYDTRDNRESLVSREALGRRRSKHRRILRQFALGMEAVTRFVQRNSLDAVHECVLGVLAQEVAPTMKT
jgi:protein phosphatase